LLEIPQILNIGNRKMAASTFKIYTIEGIDYDAIIAKYRQICIEGEWEFDINTISAYGNIEPKRIQTREPRNPLKDDTKIKRKAIYLVHTIAYRQVTNRDNSSDGVTIRTELLQDVIYEDYYELVKALEQLGYIKVSPYIIGKSSRRYKIFGSITTIECSDNTISEYINKAKKLLKEAVLERMATPEFKALYGDTFAETYIKNLNKFKIKDEKGFNKYANGQIALQPTKESYYNFIKESFKKDLKIYSMSWMLISFASRRLRCRLDSWTLSSLAINHIGTTQTKKVIQEQPSTLSTNHFP
jgi:hypothetical protein